MIWPEEWWFTSLDIPRLWKELGKGEGAVVAIWDSGLDLKANFIDEKRRSGSNFLSGQASSDFHDTRPGMHGSELARLIAGAEDRGGIAPGCQLRVARAADEPRWADYGAFASSAEFVDAHIVNISHAFLPSNRGHAAVVASMRASIPSDQRLVVAACGNYGRAPQPVEVIPASIQNVVAVAATENAAHAPWRKSTNAKNVMLAAPGYGITGIYSSSLVGTSFSTAIVSAVCALIVGFLRRAGRPHGKAELLAVLNSACVLPTGADPAVFGQGVIHPDKLIHTLKP